jgi:hypothetical protein
MSRYHEGATLSDAARFFSQRREEDQQPSDTPNDQFQPESTGEECVLPADAIVVETPSLFSVASVVGLLESRPPIMKFWEPGLRAASFST